MLGTGDQAGTRGEPAPEALAGLDQTAFLQRWIAAAAAYPVLRWPLTLALGRALADSERGFLPDEALVLALSRRMWFRLGEIPQADRVRLLRTLSRRDLQVTRRTIAAFLQKQLVGEAAAGRASPRAVAALIDNLPSDAEPVDPLLTLVLRGRRPGPLQLGAARFRARLPRRLAAALTMARMLGLGGLVLLCAAAAVAGPELARRLVPPRIDAAPVDYVRLQLSACGAPPGTAEVLTLSSAGQALTLQAPIALSRDFARLEHAHTPSEDFDRAWISPDLTRALTLDDAGVARLWNLTGPGVVTLEGLGPDVDFVSFDGVGVRAVAQGRTLAWDGRGRPAVTGGDAARPATPPTRGARAATGAPLSVRVDRGGVHILPEDRTLRREELLVSGLASLRGAGVSAGGQVVIADCDPRGRIRFVQTAPSSNPTARQGRGNPAGTQGSSNPAGRGGASNTTAAREGDTRTAATADSTTLTADAAGPPVASATTSRVSVGAGGYLTLGATALAGELPAPPDPLSAGAARDAETFLMTRKLDGSARWRQAQQDYAEISEAHLLTTFSCAAGLELEPQSSPKLGAIMGRLVYDAQNQSAAARQIFQQKRPYLPDENNLCVPRTQDLDKTWSYPALRATLYPLLAALLTQLDPMRQSAYERRGQLAAESGVVCGTETLSGSEAGRRLSGLLLAQLNGDPKFKRDLAGAQQELTVLRSRGGRPDIARCALEAEVGRPLDLGPSATAP